MIRMIIALTLFNRFLPAELLGNGHTDNNKSKTVITNATIVQLSGKGFVSAGFIFHDHSCIFSAIKPKLFNAISAADRSAFFFPAQACPVNDFSSTVTIAV